MFKNLAYVLFRPLAFWLHKKWISWWVAISLIFCVALTVLLRYDPHKLFAILTTLLLLLASHLDKLSSWLKNSIIQFLGRISYSLFLIHGTVGWRILSVGDRLTVIMHFFRYFGLSLQ
jgi:peptidoglycan/LPS O-acetylase OafA/YrhL